MKTVIPSWKQTIENLKGLTVREKYEKMNEQRSKIQSIQSLIFDNEKEGKMKRDEVESYNSLINFVKTVHFPRMEDYADDVDLEKFWINKFLHIRSVLNTYETELLDISINR